MASRDERRDPTRRGGGDRDGRRDESPPRERDLAGRDRAVFIISIAAELSGVHPQTLRVYERRGLLNPARTGGMSRRYSQTDIDRVVRIQELTAAGLNLAGVERVLEMEAEIAALRNALTELRARSKSSRHDLVPLHQEVSLYRPERP